MKAVDNLLQITSEVFLLSDILSNSRKIQYIEARSIIYVLLRDHLHLTFQKIANIFDKNHATVLHAYNQFPSHDHCFWYFSGILLEDFCV